MPKKKPIVIDDDKNCAVNVKKANNIIRAIGGTKIMSQKMFLMALQAAQPRTEDFLNAANKEYYNSLKARTGVDFSKGLIAELDNAEARKLWADDSGWFYTCTHELFDQASPNSLAAQWTVSIQDKNLIGFVSIITSLFYDGDAGKMYIKFNEDLEDQLFDLKKNYTLLNYVKMMKIESMSGFRMYELLLSEIGLQDGRTHQKENRYVFEYGLSRLKYLLGRLDAKLTPDIRKAVRSAVTDSDFERIEKLSIEASKTKGETSSDFIRHAVRRGIGEINEVEDEFEFNYELIKRGRGGRTVGVRFIITRKQEEQDKTLTGEGETIEKKEVPLSDADRLDFIDDMRAMFTEKFSTRDLLAIADAAQFNIEKIKKAYDSASESRTDIENLTGWMISAIKNGYHSSAKVKKERKKATNKFINHEQRDDVDYDAIAKEKALKSFGQMKLDLDDD